MVFSVFRGMLEMFVCLRVLIVSDNPKFYAKYIVMFIIDSAGGSPALDCNFYELKILEFLKVYEIRRGTNDF